MDQEKSSNVPQEANAKAAENEKPQVASEKQPEDSDATEVPTSESENQLNGNEIPLELESEVVEGELAPDKETGDNEEPVSDTESVPQNEPVPESEPALNAESVSNTESVLDAKSETIAEPLSDSNPLPIEESNLKPVLEPKSEESELQNTESEQNEESEPQGTESQPTDASIKQSPKDKAGTPGRNQKRGFKSPKAGNCDKYGWPIGSKYFTNVQDSASKETDFTEDEDIAEVEGNDKNNVNQQDEEILFSVTSPVHKRANTKRTIIKVEEIEGAITDGIHAGTHLPHFLTYLSLMIKFRLTVSRLPDKKLKITIRFGGKGGETLRNVICLWLRREDEDKDKIFCEGLSRNKEEILILLAQKFHEMEHLKEDPIALYEEVKQLVPKLRGKEGLRSEDEAFRSAYQELDDKLCTLVMLLYREGCGREGKNEKTLSQFRDMYFSLQIKPGFTVKQYLWAFYYYNLVFTPCLPRGLEQMMQKYATLKNLTLPATPALIFPPGGQTNKQKTSTVINPFAKKNLQSPKQGNLPKENSYAEYEMVPANSDGFVSQATEQFKKPAIPKNRNAQRRRQANQRNRKVPDAGNNPKNLPNQRNPSNQRNNPRNQSNQKNPQNQRRNLSNQRDNLPNQRNPQSPRNPRNLSVQRNPPNLRNLPNSRSPANQTSPANKRRQANQGGPANKKRLVNRGGPANPGASPNQGGPPIKGSSQNKAGPKNSGISVDQAIQGNSKKTQSNQTKPAGRKNQQSQRNPPGQRNNLNQRNNQPNQRNNLPSQRKNLPNQRNNQSNLRNNQPIQRNNSLNQRNNPPNQRNNPPNQRNNPTNERNHPQNQRNNQQRNFRPRRRSDFRKRGPNSEQNFSMSDMPRNQGFSSPSEHEFLMDSLRNQDYMQHNNLRNQDFGRSPNFHNQRNQSFTSSSSRNFSPGNHSRSSSFSQSNNPRSLFSQDFFDMPRNQNYSPNNSPNQSYSHHNPRSLQVWSSDFFGNSQDFFAGPSNFSDRTSSMNRSIGDMQSSSFNSRMPFDNEMNAHYFSNSGPNKNWDNQSNRGKRKNFRDSWGSKRQKQGT